jgi:23S rRNA (uracil1939-C5)-methyltransferase
MIKKAYMDNREPMALNVKKKTDNCLHFPLCGGCNHLDIPYNEQLATKRQMLIDLFKPTGIAIPPVIPSPENYYYRHKVQLPFGISGKGKIKQPAIGCYEANSHRVVDQHMCLIQDRDCTLIVQTIRKWVADTGLTVYNRHTGTGFLRYLLLRRGNGTGETLIGFITSSGRPKGSRNLSQILLERLDKAGLEGSNIVGIVQNINNRFTNVVLGNEELVWWGRPYIKERMGEWHYRIGLSTFFQVNPFQTPQLYNEVLNHVPQGARVLDCYCGAGSIALWISKKAGGVLGIDENLSSIRDARAAASYNRAQNTAFKQGDVEQALMTMSRQDYTCAVLDPPREGLTERLIKTLNASAIERIIYVSCNPLTLKRDIMLLKRFLPASFRAIDMFPHTDHIECVALLES